MRDVSYYRALPYRRVVEQRTDSDGSTYFIARIAEIPPIRIHGQSREEALLKLDELFADVVESLLEMGEEIPEPAQWPAGYTAGSNLGQWQAAIAAPSENVVVYSNERRSRGSKRLRVELSQVKGQAVSGVR